MGREEERGGQGGVAELEKEGVAVLLLMVHTGGRLNTVTGKYGLWLAGFKVQEFMLAKTEGLAPPIRGTWGI